MPILSEPQLAGSGVRGRSGSRSFKDGLITEVGFPALDATSKNAQMMTLQISPEQIKYEKFGDAGRAMAALSLQTRGYSSAGAKQLLNGGKVTNAIDRLRAAKMQARLKRRRGK